MASTEERMQILKMIEQGKISATEGAELLRALDQESRSPKNEPLKGASAPRWFRAREVEGIEYQQIVEAIKRGQQGKVMDVTDDESGERIEIFVE